MREKIDKLEENLKSVIKGKDEIIHLVLNALCSGGNILMDDVPGVGKTTMAKALALSIDGDFTRVQFTPDLLPSDITGSSIYNPHEAEFRFRRGPIFTNIFLADEINRASPRTQSALLEAMNEAQITVEGVTYKLEQPFLVIATENPVEYQGTYPLPEAQLDRFALEIKIGYPSEKDEVEILFSRHGHDPLDEIKPVINCKEICAVQKFAKSLNVEKTVAHYIVKVIRATREDDRVKLGASPRALIVLYNSAQAEAFLNGRDFVIPEDVKKLAPIVLSHRIILENKAKYAGVSKKTVIDEILDSVSIPV
jgi:MoxR-like ATPase